MDKIRIQGLVLYGFHGVYPEENKLGQRFKIHAELGLPLHKAGQTDQLSYTINYAEICTLIQKICMGNTYQLLESLAEAIANEILSTYTQVEQVKIQVIKLHPPLQYQLEGIEVEILRKRV